MAGPAVRQGAQAADAERTLAARAATGDADAYDALIQPRLDGLFQTALGILRHEADARDAVQDACVRAWRELGRLRDADRLDAWLGRILVNACRDRLRSRRRSVVREIDIAAVGTAGREPPAPGRPVAERVAEIDAVRRAFLRLRPNERVVLALHHGQQRPVDEIAELLAAPVGTVKWRLHVARKALARALERER